MKPVTRKGFSLVEVLVALAVLGLISAGAADAFFSVQQAWRAQRNAINLTRNSRWALERMVSEIRQCTGFMTGMAINPPDTVPAGRNIQIFNMGADTVWYWRGNGGITGDVNTLYRGTGWSFTDAYLNRRTLTHTIVGNTSGNNIFSVPESGLCTIELTVRPRPTVSVGSYNRNYTLRTQARHRI